MIDLRLGDCAHVMRDMADASIDLILTSPPYDNLRSYANGCNWDFEATATECKRLLKPGGVIVWVVGDQTKNGSESGTSFRQALHFKAIGLRLHDTMIYEKRNPIPLNHNRYEQAFEFMFVLSKCKPRVVNTATEPCLHPGRRNRGEFRVGGPEGDDLARGNGYGKPFKPTKVRKNIWRYDLGSNSGGHPATFPLQLAIDHILSWTNEGDTVLDPFVGSGTTMEACLKTGRDGIGIDVSPSYLAIAGRRIEAARPEALLWPT